MKLRAVVGFVGNKDRPDNVAQECQHEPHRVDLHLRCFVSNPSGDQRGPNANNRANGHIGAHFLKRVSPLIGVEKRPEGAETYRCERAHHQEEIQGEEALVENIAEECPQEKFDQGFSGFLLVANGLMGRRLNLMDAEPGKETDGKK